MSTKFTYHHPRADLEFTWDGGCQIMIRTGRSLSGWGVVPDRIDIREPELWRTDLLPPAERPQSPRGLDVVMVPATRQAFEEACNAWWQGRDITTSRDFRTNPLRQTEIPGPARCGLDVRYTGGTIIEASPAHLDAWQPIVDIRADAPFGKDPAEVTAKWLMGRIDGWITGVLEHLGVVRPQQTADPATYGWDVSRETAAWTARVLRTQVAADCIAGAWRTWLHSQIHQAWALPDGPSAWRNAGIPMQHITQWRPWTCERVSADGKRWNFLWCGNPYAFVYSPDTQHRGGVTEDIIFLRHPREQATGPLRAWLETQADQWIATHNG